MAEAKAERLANRAVDLGLVTDRQVQEIWTELGSRNVATDDFFQLCVRRGALTNYQVELLTKGERRGYFYGDYKILYMVGAGTFARVFRASHRQTEQIYAVKVLRRRYSDSNTQSSQFIREGQLGKSLQHPNVVAVHEVTSADRAHFIVMDFVEGWNLRDFVKIRRRIEPLEATRIMADVARGLNHAHQQGLAHRDMKMTNVLVSSRGQAKLADFGLASISDELSNEMIAEMDIPNTRTIEYAALERATGVRRDDTRSDLFFLGCIYYHMLAGQSPLVEPKDKYHRISRARFEDIVPIQQVLPNLPQPVLLVVKRAMQLDPDRRYQTPDKILNDLESLVARMTGKPVESGEEAATAQVTYVPEQPLKNLVLVEGDPKRQDLLRGALGKVGFAVAATADPYGAIGRFFENPLVADCLVINAQDIGQPALDAFNRLALNEKTKQVPIVLLLDEPQKDWEAKSETSPNRVVLHMPVKVSDLRSTLEKIIPEKRPI